jgi:hypothetical protein
MTSLWFASYRACFSLPVLLCPCLSTTIQWKVCTVAVSLHDKSWLCQSIQWLHSAHCPKNHEQFPCYLVNAEVISSHRGKLFMKYLETFHDFVGHTKKIHKCVANLQPSGQDANTIPIHHLLTMTKREEKDKFLKKWPQNVSRIFIYKSMILLMLCTSLWLKVLEMLPELPGILLELLSLKCFCNSVCFYLFISEKMCSFTEYFASRSIQYLTIL